jgi:hypothetical protein
MKFIDLCSKFDAGPFWRNSFALDNGRSKASYRNENIYSFKIEIMAYILAYHHRRWRDEKFR